MNEKYIGSDFNDFMEEMEIEDAYKEYLEEQAVLKHQRDLEVMRWLTNNTLIISYYKYYSDGQECSLGCKGHISHPCERCGRIGARGEADVPVVINFKD